MAAISMTGETVPAGRGLRALAFAWLALFALLLLLGIAVFVFGRPVEPMAILTFPEKKPHATAATNPQHPGAPPPAAPNTPAGAPPAPVPVPPATAVPNNITAPIYAGRSLVADPQLIENTAQGPLPRIAADGTPPMRAYAAPALDNGHPRIAIVVSGLGISAKATAAALASLPPQVTLAFAPYASDVQRWVAEARREGHEVLLEIPMEPYDFPDSDPGPHTLRSGVGEDANTERLTWALTRFTGYTGVTNLLGGRLMSDADSLEPVMTYLARRGLLFYDNGGANRSAAPDVAARAGVPFAQASDTIDSIQTAMEIDRQLSDLETRARGAGIASGSGFLYPVTIERVTAWAHDLPNRGFVLVPASAIVQPKK